MLIFNVTNQQQQKNALYFHKVLRRPAGPNAPQYQYHALIKILCFRCVSRYRLNLVAPPPPPLLWMGREHQTRSSHTHTPTILNFRWNTVRKKGDFFCRWIFSKKTPMCACDGIGVRQHQREKIILAHKVLCIFFIFSQHMRARGLITFVHIHDTPHECRKFSSMLKNIQIWFVLHNLAVVVAVLRHVGCERVLGSFFSNHRHPAVCLLRHYILGTLQSRV